MAGITQTIPSFVSGISQQPDHLKFQGQLTDIVNAVPDITLGLYKRPGAKRIGTTPLSSVQSNGSWFHYYRDETEGSYVGQVATDGQVRVWRCSDGQLMTTNYGAPDWEHNTTYYTGDKVNNSHTDNIYKATTTVSSGVARPTHTSGITNGWEFIENESAAQTRVQNYLATSVSENLQFLTINDTTFVCSRDASNANTLIGETGSTADRPEAHCAMVELIRTENGRQYGMNIYDSTATSNLPSSLTTVKRATKVKITGNSYAEGDGTGHCPGIGTEVYTVTAKSSYGATENIVHVKNSGGTVQTSGKDNLVFRVTALGQQGVSPNYNASSNGPGGSNYRCSYNLEVVLLHGGEGWDVGDVVRVEPAHAATANASNAQAYIEVSVTEIETTEVKATLTNNGDGLVRPSPTPFDADTAVTADTILAGITAQLPSGISAKVIGPGIYLSSSNPFNVEIVEEDLMRVFQKSVNDVTRLPNMCRHGYVVKVSNARMSDEDDYYLRFNGENGLDGAGAWSECPIPGITDTLTNMPLVIQRTAVDTFTVKEFEYEVRRVGDDNTNPMPTFVGKRINKVLFFRNRLAILSAENVILSRPGTLGRPDFFIESALTVSASDPIDISAASMFPSDIFDGIEINAGLLVFSSNQQFLLSTDDTVLNPDTAKLRSVSTFNYNKDVPPISLGTTISYLDNSGKFSRLNEMANTSREGEPDVVEISKLVPTLLPKDLDLFTNSRENSIILIGKTNSDTVFGYKYLSIGDRRQQQAWFKWKLNNPLLYHFIINDEYFFVDTDNFLQSIKLVQSDDDPTITTATDTSFQIHLDNHTTVSGGSYNATASLTTFTNVSWLPNVTTPNYQLVVIDEGGTTTPTDVQARYAEATVSNTTFTLPGNWEYSVEHEIPHTNITLNNERITITDHGLSTGDEIKWVQGTTAATGLTNGTNYFVIKVDNDTLSLATNLTNANAGTAINITGQGTGTHKIQKVIKDLRIGYLYEYLIKFPTIYPKKISGEKSFADVNSSLIIHRIKLHFGKIGLYATTLERVGKDDYTEVYESAVMDSYSASRAPYLEDYIKTIPVYEKNKNVDITLKSSHPAPATLRAMAWEGDYSPLFYRRA